MTRIAAREIRELLRDRLDELIGRLFAGERIRYPTMSPRNPTREDRTPGSLVIWTRGAAKGGYHDYATGQKGDVIDLIAFAHNREGDSKFAFDYARDFLGLAKMSPQAVRAAKERASKNAGLAKAAEDAAAASRRIRAFELYRTGAPAEGSIVEDYLGTRAIALAAVPNSEGALRFAPALEYWKGATWDKGRKVAPGEKLPAMLAPLRNLAGDITAVHCTFLRRDGSGKADVENAKLMLGDVRGSAIRISRGPDNLPVEVACLRGARTPLVITEGIEDALSAAIALPEARVWAASSLGNLGNVPVPSCAASVIVAADNDWHSAQAREQLERAIEALQVHGVPVSVMRAHEGKDMNDLLKGAA